MDEVYFWFYCERETQIFFYLLQMTNVVPIYRLIKIFKSVKLRSFVCQIMQNLTLHIRLLLIPKHNTKITKINPHRTHTCYLYITENTVYLHQKNQSITAIRGKNHCLSSKSQRNRKNVWEKCRDFIDKPGRGVH